MFAASDGSMAARRVSGSKAGCSSAWLAPFSSHRRQSQVIFNSRSSRRRLRRQLTKMLSAAAVPTSVRIVTKDSVRVKRILAEVLVQASVEQVWRVLTDYNKLADFVPNLEACERMAGAPPGKQRLRQKACSQSLYWRLHAEAVVDVREVFRSLGRRELHFQLVEGDFQEFSGRWVLEPDPSVQDGLSLATVLRYEVSIVPKWSLPSTLVTTIIRCGLPANVRAIADKAEKIAEKRRTAPKFALAALADEPIPDTWANSQAPEGSREEVLPAKGPVRAATLPFSPTEAQLEEGKGRVLKSTETRKYLGLLSVPVPFPVPKQPTHRWEMVIPKEHLVRADGGYDRRLMVQASYPSFSGDDARGGAQADGSIEVHLRRLDDPLTLHRRVVASVTIEASLEEVWQVLTDYERLPEFVPNLAISERLETPPRAPKRLVRLRQVGYKSMMYMHLHAEATLALVESPCSEIQFRQLSGDFQLLQGKFILQDTVAPEDKQWNLKQQTALKYAVEVEIPRTATMLGLLEPLLEQVVYQDIPANLEALKQRVEQWRLDALGATKGSQQQRDKQTWAAEVAADFELLEAELRRAFGEAGPLPSQRVVNETGGQELLQAIQAHGGFYEVSKRLGWKMDFQPRSQMSLQQLRHAFDEFAAAEGLQAAALPSSRLLGAKRPDLQKEADKWGGLAELAELWEYSLATNSSQISAEDRCASEEQLDLLLRQKQDALRPKRAHMIAEFDVLAAELQRCFGEGPLPTITHIRSIRRNDLDVAIKHHGGPVEVSRRMGWATMVGRRSPWSDLENCRRALDSFCREEGLPQGTVPSLYYMQQAKRYDLCTAVRHWGGLSRLARTLGYQISTGSRNSSQLQAGRATQSRAQRRGKPAAAGSRAPGKSLGKDMRQEIDSW